MTNEAAEMLNSALAQVDTARHYASLVKLVASDSPTVHDLTALMRQEGHRWAEVDGWLCLRIGEGEVVWDGRDYAALRLSAYQAEIPPGLTAEALNERLEDPPRVEKWNELQAIRQSIKDRYPKPETEGSEE